MITLNLFLNGNNCWPDLKQLVLNRDPRVVHVEKPVSIALMDGGMESGKHSVTLRLDLPSGEVVIAETSWALFNQAFIGMAARVEMEGGEVFRGGAA